MTDRPLLVHVHIPRTAGTAISHWLSLATKAGATSGHAAVYTGAISQVEAGLIDNHLYDPRVQTISSHDVRTFSESLFDRPAQYFTILREPLGQFASYMRYIFENRDCFRVPRRLRDERDIVEWFLDARFGELGRENPQTNHLALHTWCAMFDGRFEPADYPLWSNHDTHLYWTARLEIAKSVLRSFVCVGIFERLTESLRTLRERSAPLGIGLLSESKLPLLNETRHRVADEPWMDPEGPLYQQIADSLAVDVALYHYACDLFAAQSGDVAPAEALV